MKQGFEVQYCKHVPEIAPGEADMDHAQYVRTDFANKNDAISYAKKVLPLDCFGQVSINEFISIPYEPDLPAVTYREYVGEEIFID